MKTYSWFNLRKSIGHSFLRRALLVTLALACFALSPATRAVEPPPDGYYPGFNTAEGQDALFSLTNGERNTAVGYQALFSDVGGSENTAIGYQALFSNTLAIVDGSFNTATGSRALYSNTNGNGNTANGWAALYSNTIGIANAAYGAGALLSNTSGHDNTATGFQALNSNSTGNVNTSTGSLALSLNTTGIGNTASGAQALQHNTTGTGNTANGLGALFSNTTGNGNTANGFEALVSNTTGSSNIVLGRNAGFNLTTGDNNIDIGNSGVAAEANTIRIGTQGTQTKTFIAGISGTAIGGGGGAVRVNANGQLGTAPSSARFKQKITPMDKASEAILALKPVTFHYKKEFDPDGTPQFGLIAEEVAKVNPDLVACDADGEIYTVRYDAVNAMLLNEFLKEHRKVEELEATIAQQQKKFESRITRQQKQIEVLTAGLQKVSDQIEASKPAPRMVLNSH
jgi:uncharacterized coiled-coil protein SlyX